MNKTVGTGEHAIKWALQEYAEDPDTAVAFLRAWQDGGVANAIEWSEYRYWLTGVHESVADEEHCIECEAIGAEKCSAHCG